MRALILGATGLVGHCLYRHWKEERGWEVLGTFHSRPWGGLERADILQEAGLRATLERFRPQAVVLTASNPHVDHCERHPEETRRINVEATLAAAEAARAAGAVFVFFSSDYVFDGAAAPYREGDPVRPLNAYGRQKVEAERGIRALSDEHLILRVSGVFGWELAGKNAVMQLLRRAREEPSKGPVPAATDAVYNPTYAPDLGPVLAELLERGARGLYHAAGAEQLSRFELLAEAARAFDLGEGWVRPVLLRELPAPASRPLRSGLDSASLRRVARAPLRGAREALARMRADEQAWKRHAAAPA